MATVLNWLWQGAVVALAAATLLWVTRSSRSQARYVSMWVALVSILVLPFAPFVWATASAERVLAGGRVPVGHVLSMPASWWTSSGLLISLWLLWSTLYAGRLGAAVLALRRAKRHSRPVPRTVESQFPHWSRVRTSGRPTRLLLSDEVRSAAVLGWGAPVIAVAPALLEYLNDDELDYVVIHEWAHVQRHDDVANFVQLVIAVIAGWHPAVWWVNRQLHIERELACDETVVAMAGCAKEYAGCLAKLASLPVLPLQPLPAVAASSSDLSRRIVRILSAHHSVSPRSWAGMAIGASIPLLVIALSVGGVRLVETAAAMTDVGGVTRPSYSDAIAAKPFLSARPTANPSFSEQVDSRSKPSPNRPRGVGRPGAQAQAAVARAVAPPTGPVFTGSAMASVPQEEPLHTITSRPTVTLAASESPGPLPSGRILERAVVVVPNAIKRKPASPWDAATDGGLAVGRASQKAAATTAGFFSRFGKNLAGAF